MNGRLKWMWIIALVVVLLFAVLAASGPLILLSIEADILKRELENPYIDGDFQGWVDFDITEDQDIKIPDRWAVEKHGDVYTFISSDGQIVGYGIDFDSDVSDTGFFSELTGSVVDNVQLEYLSDLTIGGSCVSECLVSGNGTTARYLCVDIIHSTPIFSFAFPIQSDEGYDALLQIVEAMLFSYEMM